MKKRTTGMIKKLTSLMLAGALVFTPLGSIQGNAVSAAVSNVESAVSDTSEEHITDADEDASFNNEETADKTGIEDDQHISDDAGNDVSEEKGNVSDSDPASDEDKSENDEESGQADPGNDDNEVSDTENGLDKGTANDVKEDIAEQELNEEVKVEIKAEFQSSEAFNEFKIVDGVGVSVTAPEDVFPNGSKLSVKSLKSGSVFNKIADYLEYVRPENKKSVLKYIIDVRAYKDSEDISGDINGEIKLSFLIRDTRITETTSVNVYRYDKYWGFTSVDDADVTIEDYPLLATHTELDTDNVTCISVNTDSLAYYAIEFTENITEDDYWTLTLDYGDAIVWQENGGAYYYIKGNGEYGKTRNKEDALRNAHRFAEIKVPKGIEKDVNVRYPIYATEVNGTVSVFNGWQNEDGTVHDKYLFENYMPASNEKYTAQWDTDLCKVTMDYGEIAPTWRDDNDYTYYFDETGNLSGAYDPDEAKLRANTFSIQYYRRGEKFQTNPDKVRKNIVIEFNGTEYRIERWENEDGIKIENVKDYIPTSDMTLHAIWTDKLCHVTIYQDDSYSYSYTLIQGEQLKNYPVISEILRIYGKKLLYLEDEDGKKYTYDELINLVINKDINFTAFYKGDIQGKTYKAIIHPNNGYDDILLEVRDYYTGNELYRMLNDQQLKYPDGMQDFELYADEELETKLDDYLYDNIGFTQDTDVYIKWIYGGKWVETDGGYRWLLNNGEYLKASLLNHDGCYYYLNSDGYRVYNTWVALPESKEESDAGRDYYLMYFQGENDDGAAVVNAKYTIGGLKYIFDKNGHKCFGFVYEDPYHMINDEGDPGLNTIYYCGDAADAGIKPPDPSRTSLKSGWVKCIFEDDSYDYYAYYAGDTYYLYFDPYTYRKVTDETRLIDGKYYHFDSNGVCFTYEETRKKITFDKQGGNGGTSEIFIDNTATNLPLISAPVNRGYVFYGYYTEKDGQGTKYYNADGTSALDDISAIDTDITLYAYWGTETVVYNVEHYKQDADGEYKLAETESLSGMSGSDTQAAAKSYEHYNVKAVEQQKIESDGSTIVKIYYDRDIFSISFDVNGHGSAPSPIKAIFGANVTAPEAPVCDGYTFAGWYKDVECSEPYTFTEMPAGDITVYVKWTAKQYKISFDAQADGITVSFTDKDVTYGEKVGELPTVSERIGYEFKGWYSNTSEGRQLTEDTIVDILADRTYYGVWEAKSYKVILELNGGNIKSGDVSGYVYGQETKLPTELENGNKIFAGWYTAADFSTDAVTAIPADSIGDKIFYAKWIDMAVDDTVIDISELDTSAGSELEQAANEAAKNEITSNNTVKAPAEDLNNAVDKDKLETSVSDIIAEANKNRPDTEEAISITDVNTVKLGLEIKPKAILSEEENGKAAVTGIKFEAKPYMSVIDKNNNEIGKAAVANEALKGRITVKLPVPDQLKGKYAKIVHVFSDGTGEETIRCTIKGTSPDRYVEFTVDKFSEFNIEFTDDYYSLNNVASIAYTGRYIRPEVKVKAGDAAVPKSEYSVAYRNNINVGQAEIVVTINSTGERLTETFDITKARPVINADNVTAVYDGSRHGVQVSVNIPDGIILGSSYYRCRYYTDAACTKNESADAPVNAGTYYALITVDETDNFFAAEKKLRVKITSKASSASGSSSGGSGGGSGTGLSAVKIGNDKSNLGINGTWKEISQGKWTFTAGNHSYKNEWALVANPYADTSKGQSAADWFRFDENGTMLTGWFTNSYGDIYYMNPVSDNTLGRMFTGWHYIDGYWYYFEEKEETRLGALSRNKTTPDGSRVNDKGQLIVGDKPVTDSKAKNAGK